MTRSLMLVLLCMNLWGKNPHAAVISQPLIHTSNQNFILKPFEQCLDHVALEAETFNSYFYLWDIYTQFLFDKTKTFLPICLLQPNNKKSLEQGIWPSQWVTVDHRNTAYVSAARMYLGFDDTYEVFIHELAHFAGFLDEYPMRVASAKYQCQIKRYAPNVIFESQLLGQSNHPYQQLFQIQLLTTSGTLRKDIEAFIFPGCQYLASTPKQYLLHPNQFNFLRFFDVAMIPYWYQYLWQQQVLTGRTAKLSTKIYIH